MRSFFDRHPVTRKLAASLVVCSAFLSPVAGTTIALASPTASTAAPAPEGAQQTQRQSAQTQQPAGQAQQQKPQGQDQKTDTQSSDQTRDEQLNTTNTAEDTPAGLINTGLDWGEKFAQADVSNNQQLKGAQNVCVFMLKDKQNDAKEFCSGKAGIAASYTYLYCLEETGDKQTCAAMAFSEDGIKAAEARTGESGGWMDLLKHPIDSLVNYIKENPEEAALNIALLALTFTPLGLPARAIQLLSKAKFIGGAFSKVFSITESVASKIPFVGFTEGVSESAAKAAMREATELVEDGGEAISRWGKAKTAYTDLFKGKTAAGMKESYASELIDGIKDIASKGAEGARNGIKTIEEKIAENEGKISKLVQDRQEEMNHHAGLLEDLNRECASQRLAIKNGFPWSTDVIKILSERAMNDSDLLLSKSTCKNMTSEISRLTKETESYKASLEGLKAQGNTYTTVSSIAQKYIQNPAAKAGEEFKSDLSTMKGFLSEDEFATAKKAAEQATESQRTKWAETFQRTGRIAWEGPFAAFGTTMSITDNNVKNDKEFKLDFNKK